MQHNSDAQEQMYRKPDGRSQLNRLSKDRQAAVADYAARHTLPETVEWLKNPGWPPEPRATAQTTPGAIPSPPAEPQGTSASRWALARWLSGYPRSSGKTPRCSNGTNRPGNSSTRIVRRRRTREPKTPDTMGLRAEKSGKVRKSAEKCGKKIKKMKTTQEPSRK